MIFTKDDIYEFELDDIKQEIIDFIKYANFIRENPLQSLPFSKGLNRTNLLEDFKKVVAFLEIYIKKD